uniref:Uncharacterized protein n=1 Tax=Rhizophora mucronata TaxID=61149 RepID=A0A2P2Q1J1_RHIMU
MFIKTQATIYDILKQQYHRSLLLVRHKRKIESTESVVSEPFQRQNQKE